MLTRFATREEAADSLLGDALSGDGHVREYYDFEGLADDLIELKEDGTFGLIELDDDDFITVAQRHEKR